MSNIKKSLDLKYLIVTNVQNILAHSTVVYSRQSSIQSRKVNDSLKPTDETGQHGKNNCMLQIIHSDKTGNITKINLYKFSS